MKRIWAVARKEFLHIRRDPRTLGFAILMPLMMVILYGYAIDMEMKNMRVGVLDEDQSASSRDFVRRMTASGFILDAGRVNSREEVEPGFRTGRYHAVIVFPPDYAESLGRQQVTPVQVLIDGADGTTAATVDNYLAAVVALINSEIMNTSGAGRRAIIDGRPRILFNPDLESAYFIVPGLVAIIMMMIGALLTSISVAREKEMGTMEQILTTPTRAHQIIIGKVIPYMGVAALDAAIVLTIGRVLFGVPMNGSWLVLAAYSIVYLLIALSLGVLISTISRTQQAAMGFALVITMLPSLMLSGFIFPIASLPPVLQVITRIIPATYYVIIIRGVMLKGEAWFPVEFAVMVVMVTVLMGMAIKRFKGRLE